MQRRAGDGVTAILGLRGTLLVTFVGSVLAQITPQYSGWMNTCTNENYQTMKLQMELCPRVFKVSTLAFNPLYPRINATATLILQPSEPLAAPDPRATSHTQFIYIELPGFTALGELASDPQYRMLSIMGNNPVSIGQSPLYAYNNPQNMVFKEPALYHMASGVLQLEIFPVQRLLPEVDTEIKICCFRLPMMSPADNTSFRIWAPTSLSTDPATYTIADEAIKSSPFIDPGFQWSFFQVEFDPPVSKGKTTIILTFRSANDLTDSCRIIFHAPGLYRIGGQTGPVEFSTALSPLKTDWLLLRHQAYWNQTARTLTFYLRQGVVLEAERTLTLQTYPNEFRLPTEIPANVQSLMLEARSYDGIDEVIKSAPVYQSSRVPHIRNFTYSSIDYTVAKPNTMTSVHFSFMSNRPMFSGTSIQLRLSGFRANRLEIPIVNAVKAHFTDEVASFDLPSNILTLRVNKTLYSNEMITTVIFNNLRLPLALYSNDSSLMVRTSDPGASWQPIASSPQLHDGALYEPVKQFIQSQVLFEPMEPNMASNVTFKIRPSVPFYQGDMIVLHLYGFNSLLADIPVHGPSAHRVRGRMAQWVETLSLLVFVVADDEIVPETEVFEVEIYKEYNFRLPDKLSLNDGILRIEGRGTLIYKEPFKKTPMIGDEKFVIWSKLMFEPGPSGILVSSIAKLSMSLIFNTDVLPNSTINIKLGGIEQADGISGPVTLSGANAPMFIGGKGDWVEQFNMLTVVLVQEVTIRAGEEIRFFIEIDERFILPYAMYPNDPSFQLEVREAGITPPMPFNFSTRVNMETKRFLSSSLKYGDIAFPDTVVEVNFHFRPNVELGPNCVIRFHLPGFTSPDKRIATSAQAFQLKNVDELTGPGWDLMYWDQTNFNLDLRIPLRKRVSRLKTSAVRILKVGGFRLPKTPFEPNDKRLTISVVENQLIYEASIQKSPRVVDRSFLVSTFEYFPAQRETIFKLRMRLQPTVNITNAQPIVIKLPGFINSLSKLNIHIMGANRSAIDQSMAKWNATTSELKMLAPRNKKIMEYSMLELEIEESQGFILPKALDENDHKILISSGIGGSNIPPAPIKKSPMVGNGPFPGHRFCMYQNEPGTRTIQPICTAANAADPPLTDPCSAAELARTGCSPKSQLQEPLRINGFNLQVTDTITFLPQDQLCSLGATDGILGAFNVGDNVTVSDDRGSMLFEGVTSIQTGKFRICLTHKGTAVFDVGIVHVRPNCANRMVMVDGVCVEHCPKSTVPRVGDCLEDPVASEDWDRQALMLSVRMKDKQAGLAESASDEPDRRYFVYRFTYELAKLLNCDPTRILVVSLSNGSLIVNTVFTAVNADGGKITTDERSPMGLISLLQALQSDMSSPLYESSFFREIDRTYMPQTIPVRDCGGDYRIFCPYDGSIMAVSSSVMIFLGLGSAIAAVLSCCCICLWTMDKEGKPDFDENMVEQIRENPRGQPWKIQLEYSNSWLEGRFMGEEWEHARKRNKMIAAN
jgi:hypothetical protein